MRRTQYKSVPMNRSDAGAGPRPTDGPLKFDAAYYRHFYRDPRTRAASQQETLRRGDFVCSYLKHMEIPVRRVVDVGCGLGWMRTSIEKNFPRATYTGVEISEYLCEQYGFDHGSAVDYAPSTPFDLVICHDVLQYLPDNEASKALANLTRMCRGALYLGVLTERDWNEVCDQQRTDNRVHLRTGQWYKKRLSKSFQNAGGGVYVLRDANVLMWEIEYL